MDTNDPVIDDVGKTTQQYILKKYKIFVIILAFFTIGIGFLVFKNKIGTGFIILPIVAIISFYVIIQSKILKQFMQQFGASIGFKYEESAGLATVHGELFSVGHSQNIYNVLTGIYKNRDSRLFSYEFSTGSDKNSRTFRFTVFETTLKNNIPNIILRSNTTPGPDVSLFDKSNYIKLEGDFHKFFTLEVPNDYEIEAYQIFTPDVMVYLIDHAKDLNFEFDGNKLYIFKSGIITNREKLNSILDLSRYLSDLMVSNSEKI